MDTQTPVLYFPTGKGLPIIQADIPCPGVIRRIRPEGKFDDSRRIHAYAQFPVQDTALFVVAQEIMVPLVGIMPAVIFYKGIIDPQMRYHAAPVVGASGNQ